MLRYQGVPLREINGLPYTLHRIGENEWQIVIQNCARHPAGYSLAPVYGSYEDAVQALDNWPQQDVANSYSMAGDDTGASMLTQYED